MKDNISITVPMEYNALTRTADMLNALAHDLALKDAKIPAQVPSNVPAKAEQLIEDIKKIEPISIENIIEGINDAVDASTVFNKNVVPLNPSLQGAENIGNEPPPAPQAAPVGVELDSDGLPWDARIHGSKKLKLAKTQQWKKKRGVDPTLVATVEAELRAAMAAPVAVVNNTPVVSVETVHVEAVAPVDLVTETPLGAVPPAPTGMTFPELMSKITTAMGAGTVTETMVIAACNNQSIASLPLLAVRPDLVPAVDAELFPS